MEGGVEVSKGGMARDVEARDEARDVEVRDVAANYAKQAGDCGLILQVAQMANELYETTSRTDYPPLDALLRLLAFSRRRLAAEGHVTAESEAALDAPAVKLSESHAFQARAQVKAVRSLQRNEPLSVELILACAGPDGRMPERKAKRSPTRSPRSGALDEGTARSAGGAPARRATPKSAAGGRAEEGGVAKRGRGRRSNGADGVKTPRRRRSAGAGGPGRRGQAIDGLREGGDMTEAAGALRDAEADSGSRPVDVEMEELAQEPDEVAAPEDHAGEGEGEPAWSAALAEGDGELATGDGVAGGDTPNSEEPRAKAPPPASSEVAEEVVEQPFVDITDVLRRAGSQGGEPALTERPAASGPARDGRQTVDMEDEEVSPDVRSALGYIRLAAERERRTHNRVMARIDELERLPVLLPEGIRREASIELRQLKLLGLQRRVREDALAEMHRLLSPRVVGRLQRSNRYFRRPAPTRPPAHDAASAAHAYAVHRREQEERQRRRQVRYLSNLLQHASEFRRHHNAVQSGLQRVTDGVRKHFTAKAREEERRRKKEDMERLRALKENDEEEYLRLVQNTKNKRLMHFLKQTDQYLTEIGAQVERQKEMGHNQGGPGRGADGAGRGGEGELAAAAKPPEVDTLEAMRRRRQEYYTLTHTVREEVKQPSVLVGGTLKPYQMEGLGWLVSLYNNNLNGILADEMGLGKTIQTIALLAYLTEFKENKGPYLIVVPLATVSNWVRELEAWFPSARKVVYRGDKATRKQIHQHEMASGEFNVILTTYEMVIKDRSSLTKWRWKYIIIDEGHRMKNADCKLALTLATYETKNRLLLTGTPLQNNLTELWALLNFLLPNIFSSSETFQQWFSSPFQAGNLGDQPDVTGEEQLLIINRLHQVLRPFLLRRLKQDVETQLPEKIERIIPCELSAWQRVLYRQIQNRLAVSGGEEEKSRSFNNVIMQLKKICNHPYLFYNHDIIDTLPSDFLLRASGKFELLDRILKKLARTGHKSLIFSQMTKALDFLEIFLERSGFRFLRMDGMTKAEDRQEMLELFNAEGSPYFCFLLSTRAGGLGLNLQAADTVIIFDSDWNPMMDLQAQDRVHRIGQTREVRVYRLICANTVEIKILEQANRKLEMESQIIQAGHFNNKFSERERRDILRSYILNKKPGEEEVHGSIPNDDEINQMLVRSEEEVEVMQAMDAERIAEERAADAPPRLLRDESDLPSWVLAPEEEKAPVKRDDAEMYGRGRRRKRSYALSEGRGEAGADAGADAPSAPSPEVGGADNGEDRTSAKRRRQDGGHETETIGVNGVDAAVPGPEAAAVAPSSSHGATNGLNGYAARAEEDGADPHAARPEIQTSDAAGLPKAQTPAADAVVGNPEMNAADQAVAGSGIPGESPLKPARDGQVVEAAAQEAT